MTSRLRDRPASRTGKPLDLLTCAICFQHLEDPRKLPCGHTFCRRCLEHHHASSRLESETSRHGRPVSLLPCPNAPDCGHVTVVPPNGVAGFPVDEHIAGIKERVVNQLAENILKSMPGGRTSSGLGSDTRSVCSDASSETTSSAPAGNFEMFSDDDEVSFKFVRGSANSFEGTGKNWSRYGSGDHGKPTAPSFDERDASDDVMGTGLETPRTRYTPDRKRVGFSSSFRLRRRHVKVGAPTAYDDSTPTSPTSPAQEFLRRQPSRCGSVPLLEDDEKHEKPTTVRGVHLREPIRRSGLYFSSDRIRPASTILEGVYINADRKKDEDEASQSSTPGSSPFPKYAKKSHSDNNSESPAFESAKMETSNRRYRKDPEKTSFDSNTEHHKTESKFSRTSGQSYRAESEASPKLSPGEQPRSFSRTKLADTENLSYHSSERVFGSSRLFSNLTGQDNLPHVAETPVSGTARVHRKLPNAPAQSYAERIRAKSRLSQQTNDSHNRHGPDFTYSTPGHASDSSTVFEMGSPPQNTSPRYESSYRVNQTNAYSGKQSEPAIPSANRARTSHFSRTPQSNGSMPRPSWGAKDAYPVDSLWNGISKYLDCSDSSDDSDLDSNVKSVNKGAKDTPSMDKQVVSEGIEGSESETGVNPGVAKGSDEPEESKPCSATGTGCSRSFETDAGNNSINGSSLSSEDGGGENQRQQPDVDGDADKPDVVNGCDKTPLNGDGPVMNGQRSNTMQVIDTNKLTVLTVVTGNDTPGLEPNTTVSDAQVENDTVKQFGDLEKILEAARIKYSTCRDPEDVVLKLVPTPVCENGIVLRWRMQRDDFATPTSMAITCDGSVFIADGANLCLDNVDQDGNLVHSVTGMKPYSVLAMGDTADSERIYVGDRKLRTVRIFDSFGCDVSQWDAEATSFGWIGGIASLRCGKLVVVDRERCKIGVFTAGGVRLSEFGAYGTNDKQMSMADFVAVDSHDRVIVADSGNHCLKLFDPNAAGKPIGRISQRGSDDGCLLWPKGVAVDGRDNIIVADTSNNRISQFSSDGQFITHLVVDTPKPYHVTVNSGANLMGVTHFALNGFSQVDLYSMNSDEMASTPAA